MLTREEIISSFKKVNFPEKIFDPSTSEVKNIIFYSESTEPNSKKEKDIKNLNQSYVLPWRLVQKNYNEMNNKNNTFTRGTNFIPKEPIIEIKTENLKLLYDKYDIPIDTGIIYFKNNYGGLNGPYNFSQFQNMYKNKKFDSNYEFRTIDIFAFKDSELFTFKNIKIINEDNWTDLIIKSPLITNDKKEPKKDLGKKIKEEKKSNIEKEEKVDNEIKEEKKDEKKEENKEEIKEEKKEEKKEINVIKKEEEKWEVVGKKKNKTNKEKESEEEDNGIIGLKNKNSKEVKKGKKKKKGKFEDVDVELGFKIK